MKTWHAHAVACVAAVGCDVAIVASFQPSGLALLAFYIATGAAISNVHLAVKGVARGLDSR